MLKELNQFVQNRSGKKYSFITANGTSAIYLALKSAGLQKGSKVIVPNIACPDPVYALIWAGYKPLFVDVNIDDYNMDISRLKKILAKEKDIRAVIAIHLFGNPCDIKSIRELCDKKKLFLIEDCAQSLGNRIEDQPLGSFGDVSIFSFGNGKIIENGHGGSVQSNDSNIIEKIKQEYKKFSEYNITKIEKLSKLHRYLYYKLYYLGLKFPKLNILNYIFVFIFKNYYLHKLDSIQLLNLKDKIVEIDQNIDARQKLVLYLADQLKGIKKIVLPKVYQTSLSRYTIIIDNAEELSSKIREYGIPSNTMYPMLVDRFNLFFNKLDYQNSFNLKGKLLNIWTSGVDTLQTKECVNLIKKEKYD